MDIMEHSWKYQRLVEGKIKGAGKGKFGRVLKMAKKPDAEDYKRSLQITSLGAIAMGALGFAIYYTFKYGPEFFRGMLGL